MIFFDEQTFFGRNTKFSTMCCDMFDLFWNVFVIFQY